MKPETWIIHGSKPRANNGMRSVFSILFIACYIFFVPANLFAQRSLVGKITDAESKLPVWGATVYINNTQFATKSDDNGFFLLKGSIPSIGEVVLTHVNYQKEILRFTLNSDTIYVQLKSTAATMENVVVATTQKDTWKKWKEVFIPYFIGVGEAANQCNIINPESIRFHYNKDEKYLEAWSSTTLNVENKGLGYLLHVDVDTFRYSFSQRIFVYHISKFFEPIEPKNIKEAKTFAANRLTAYYGSRMHFLRSLYQYRMSQEGFSLHVYKGVRNLERERVQEKRAKDGSFIARDSASYFSYVLSQPLIFLSDTIQVDLNSRLKHIYGEGKTFSFDGDSLLLSYDVLKNSLARNKEIRKFANIKTGPNERYNFLDQSANTSQQFSLLSLQENTSIKFEENGYLHDAAFMLLQGTLGEKRVAVELPWDYEPSADLSFLDQSTVAPLLNATLNTELLKNKTEAVQKQIDSSFAHLQNKIAGTQLYLHLDKTIYTGNENIWFTGYVLSSPFPSSSHLTLFVRLLNKQTGYLVASQSFVMKDGLGFGYLFVPDSLPTGNYQLIAFTNTAAKEDRPQFFQQEIRVRTYKPLFSVSLNNITTSLKDPSRISIHYQVLNDEGINATGARVNYRLESEGLVIKKGSKTIVSDGELLLDDLLPGDLQQKQTKLYLEVKKDNAYFQTQTDVLLPKQYVKVSWYPEGGNLVSGIPTRLGVSVRSVYGKPPMLKGVLWSEEEMIGEINTDINGFGLVNITPVTGRKYTIRWNNDSIVQLNGPFPEILPAGVILSLEEAVVRDTINLRLSSTIPGNFFVQIHNFKEVYYSLPFQVHRRLTVKFPVQELPAGIFFATLFDSTGFPVAERAFFREPNNQPIVQINVDSSNYRNRSKVQLRISIKDAAGQPLQGVFSLACVMTDKIDRALYQDIKPYSLLQHYYGNPFTERLPYYQVPDKKEMEKFLMVHYWTRYKAWQNHMSGSPMDTFNLNPKGQVYAFDVPFRDSAELGILSNRKIKTLMTDGKGSFELLPEMLEAGPDEKLHLFVNEPDIAKQKFFSLVMQPNEAWEKQLAASPLLTTLRTDHSTAENPEPLPRAMPVVIIKTKQKAEQLESSVYKSKTCNDYVCMYKILNCENHPFGGTMPVNDETYSVRVGTMMTKVLYKSCETKREGFLFLSNLNGRYYTKEFYQADYEKFNPELPETLSTLYWNHQIETGKNGEATITFFTNDLKGSVSCFLQGISPQGVISGQSSFRVE